MHYLHCFCIVHHQHSRQSWLSMQTVSIKMVYFYYPYLVFWNAEVGVLTWFCHRSWIGHALNSPQEDAMKPSFMASISFGGKLRGWDGGFKFHKACRARIFLLLWDDNVIVPVIIAGLGRLRCQGSARNTPWLWLWTEDGGASGSVAVVGVVENWELNCSSATPRRSGNWAFHMGYGTYVRTYTSISALKDDFFWQMLLQQVSDDRQLSWTLVTQYYETPFPPNLDVC